MIEGEMPRREPVIDFAADHAAQTLAKRDFTPRTLRRFLREDDGAVLPLAEGQLQRVGEPAALLRRGHQPIDDQFDDQLASPGGSTCGSSSDLISPAILMR